SVFSLSLNFPINNYNVTVNIANYAHFQESYTADDGEVLPLDYYVLRENLAKAKKHFKQVPKVLACFERYFGKYPFWNDGFALVETPYLGMEHQSAVAYGNKYMRGYLGGMIPRSMNWDYIIVHETGHEYWGNSISVSDLSEMWIHESFTTYMESLFVECAYSYKEAVHYLATQRIYIRNREPILGPMEVNWEDWKGSDHYFKGAWVLHTLRHAINDDELWFDLLKSFYDKNYISNVTSQDFIDYVNTCTKKDWTAFFEQYLWHPDIPTLEYKLKKKGGNTLLEYRWNADVAEFDMPVLVGQQGDYQQIQPTASWQKVTLKNVSPDKFKVARELFLIELDEQ
ncbi:MAG: M1 family aminopeptidase, partial [Bacteroidota bacterium]